MIDLIRIEEVRSEIRKKERERDEGGEHCGRLLHSEDESYEDLRDGLKKISGELESCHGDKKVTVFVEEKYMLLKKMESDAGGFIDEICKEESRLKHKCDSDIEELKHELQRMEVYASDA